MFYSIIIILYCLHILFNQNRYKNKIIPVNGIKGFYFRKDTLLVTSYFYDYTLYNTYEDYTIENTTPTMIKKDVSTKDYQSLCRYFGIKFRMVEGPFIYEPFYSDQKLYAYAPLKTITSDYEDLKNNAKYDQLVWYIGLTLQYIVIGSFYRIGVFLYEENFSKN